MPKRPSRIDLLELDIDLRLADLWRETFDVTDWNLEVVAAFLRAAYGKGYCDALTRMRRARCATSTGTAFRPGSRPTRPRAEPAQDCRFLARTRATMLEWDRVLRGL